MEYARILSDWKTRGRLLDLPALTELTIAELLLRFMNDAVGFCGFDSEECSDFEQTIIPLIATYPHLRARDFGPAELKVFGQRIIDQHKVTRQIG